MPEQPTGPDNPNHTNDPTPSTRRNYMLGVANGTMTRLGMGFINPYLVLSAFVYEQTGSNFLVGLTVALSTAGLMWPQLYISALVEHLPRKRPFYLFATALRIVTLSVVVATMFLVGVVDRPWMIALFFVAYFAYRSGQGCGSPVFFDLVARSVGPRRVGGFFGYRALFGGLLSSLAGFAVIQPILNALPSPYNYATLASIALVVMGCGWILFSLVHETAEARPPEERNLRQTAADTGALMWRDGNYRLLLLIRVLLRVDLLALAFYVPYGVERLGAVGLSGVFVGCMSVSRLASSLVWGQLSDRKGNRLCLMCGATLLTVSPALALTAPRLPGAFEWTLPFTAASLDLPMTAYVLALCMVGFAMEGWAIGLNAFILESAPPDRRPSYMAFLNTASFPFTFLPALAGMIVGSHLHRLEGLFAVCTVSGLLTVLAVWRLTEVRASD